MRRIPTTLTALALALVAPLSAQSRPAPPAPAQKIFVFAQPFWVNLHHFLYVLGRAENRTPDRARRAVAGAPKDQEQGLAALTTVEQTAWRAAVSGYANTWSKKDMVFDRDLFSLTAALVAAGDAPTLDAATIDPPTSRLLEQAAPLYRKAWWPAHSTANAARIAGLQTLIAEHGAAILGYITSRYQEPWPAGGYPVNISAYTNWAGAYSTDDRLLVVSSLDAGTDGLQGLETIFHESMHQWDESIAARLSAAAARVHAASVPDSLSHAMIFYTAGQAVRSVAPDYTPYADANGVWQRGFEPYRVALAAAWQPYLDRFDAAASPARQRAALDGALDDVLRRLQ